MCNKDVRENVPHESPESQNRASQSSKGCESQSDGCVEQSCCFCFVGRMNVGLHLTGNVGSAPGNTRHSVITRLTNAHMKSHGSVTKSVMTALR